MSEPLPAFPDYCFPVDWACCSESEQPASSRCSHDEDTKLRAEAMAAQTLRALTGGRVGGCPVTVRPCRAGGCSDYTAQWYWSNSTFVPVITAEGTWINCSCGCATTGCSCSALCSVTLPGPVGYVDSVQIGGEVIPESWYTVIGSDLVWVGDRSDPEMTECGWPLCQDLAAPVGSPNTFAVSYLRGVAVDGLGAAAAGLLACEFAKACAGQACRLPYNVTSITRQGLSMQIAPASFMGGTGIPEVDAYVDYWNPGRLKNRPIVWTPGTKSMGVSR